MTRDVLTLDASVEPAKMFDALATHHLDLAPVVDGDTLLGVVTRTGALRSTIYTPGTRPPTDGLWSGPPSGSTATCAGKAAALLAIGLDVLVVDTAHGHQDKMLDVLPTVRALRDERAAQTGRRGPDRRGQRRHRRGHPRPGRRRLPTSSRSASGPGAMCTTRMMTGVGRPQFSAVLECSAAAAELGAHVWADGGVRHPRDVALAIAAGASSVMIGSWFAGTYESPGDLQRDNDGRAYKESFGMASARAVANRTRDAAGFERARMALFEEGISSVADVPRSRPTERRGPHRRDHRRRAQQRHVRRGGEPCRVPRARRRRRPVGGWLRRGPPAARELVAPPRAGRWPVWHRGRMQC